MIRGPYDTRSRNRARRTLRTGLGLAGALAFGGGALWIATQGDRQFSGITKAGRELLLLAALVAVLTIILALHHYLAAVSAEARWRKDG